MKKIMIVLSAIISLPVWAQQQAVVRNTTDSLKELKELTINGNRIALPFSQTSRDIQVITQEQIQQLPVKSINEVLAYVSGVDIRQRGPFGTQADIAIDGGTSEQTLILIDGVKMIDAQTAHNMLNIPIPLAAIDHIEVLKGASARIYGINALSGAINIVTKKENHSSLSASVQAGSSLKQKEAGDGSGIYGGGSIDLTGNYGSERQNHLFAASQSLYNGQRYNSAANNTRLFYQGNYHFDAYNQLQAMAGYARSFFGANGFYAAPGDRNSEELVTTSLLSLSSQHQWGNFKLAPRISHRNGQDDYRYFKDDLEKGRSQHQTKALMLELNSSLETSIGTFGLGWESRLENINSTNIGEHQRGNHGAYAELSSNWGKKLFGTIGLYANYNTDFGWQWYPGIDLAYWLNEQWKVAMSVGSGQRIPSFTDLYLNQYPGNVGNAHLQPEDAWNFEGNIQYSQNTVTIQAGYFYRNINQFIDWVRTETSQPYSPINVGTNKVQGIYLRLEQSLALSQQSTIGYRLSYNFLHPTVASATGRQSKYVLESLRHQVIAGLNYRFRKYSVQLENRLLQRELGAAYYIADLRIQYRLPKFHLYAEANNLFNAQYSEAGAVPMPTRWLAVGLTFQWQQGK